MHRHSQGCGCGVPHVNAVFRMDPTRTTELRRKFIAEVNRRFQKLIDLIITEVETKNGFGIKEEDIQANAGKFQFDSNQQKAASFMKWLKEQERKGILEITEGEPLAKAANKAWTTKYVRSAYQKGVANASSQLKKSGAKVSDRWVSSAFDRPIHADRVATIYMRAYRDLDGITKEMDKRISRTLAAGLAEGKSPRDIARDLVDDVETIGITRARTLARTEVIAAHSDANLSAYEEAGIHGVEVEVEWSTASDPCPICEELRGNEYTIAEARGLLPAHPNCRCAFIPKVTNGTGIELR